jgi:hypothetical protein
MNKLIVWELLPASGTTADFVAEYQNMTCYQLDPLDSGSYFYLRGTHADMAFAPGHEFRDPFQYESGRLDDDPRNQLSCREDPQHKLPGNDDGQPERVLSDRTELAGKASRRLRSGQLQEFKHSTSCGS